MKMKFLFLFFFCIFYASAQPIPEKSIKKHISFLASDQLKGRGTGTAEEKIAANIKVFSMFCGANLDNKRSPHKMLRINSLDEFYAMFIGVALLGYLLWGKYQLLVIFSRIFLYK